MLRVPTVYEIFVRTQYVFRHRLKALYAAFWILDNALHITHHYVYDHVKRLLFVAVLFERTTLRCHHHGGMLVRPLCLKCRQRPTFHIGLCNYHQRARINVSALQKLVGEKAFWPVFVASCSKIGVPLPLWYRNTSAKCSASVWDPPLCREQVLSVRYAACDGDTFKSVFIAYSCSICRYPIVPAAQNQQTIGTSWPLMHVHVFPNSHSIHEYIWLHAPTIYEYAIYRPRGLEIHIKSILFHRK